MTSPLERFNESIEYVREAAAQEEFSQQVDAILKKIADEVAGHLNRHPAKDLYVTIGEVQKDELGLTAVAFVGSNLTSRSNHVGEASAGNIEEKGFRERYWPTGIPDIFVQRTDHGRMSALTATYALVGRKYVVFNR